MTRLLAQLGSTRLAVAGLVALAVVLLADDLFETADLAMCTIGLLAALGVNLAAAMITTPRLRHDPALLVMHTALLVLLVAAALGRLYRFEAHVEVLQGAPFDASQVVVDWRGPWHRSQLDAVRFEQGGFTVDYAPGVKRAATQARLHLPGRVAPETFGDDRPFRALGYRFYTTHNKGFAAVLEWQPTVGPPLRGAVHFPPYPLVEWKQGNDWQPPGGPALSLWLHLARPLPVDQAWSLKSDGADGQLAIVVGALRHELSPGQSLALTGGELRYLDLRGWMGWRIFYDPALVTMLWSAIVAILALLWHVLADRHVLAGERRRLPLSAAAAGQPR